MQTVHYATAKRKLDSSNRTKIPDPLEEALTWNYRTKKNNNQKKKSCIYIKHRDQRQHSQKFQKESKIIPTNHTTGM
jgi:hypothetical protein